MLAGGDPRVPITSHRLVLLGQVDTLAVLLASSLGQRAGPRREAGLDGRLGLDPVGEGFFAVLDDRLAGLVAVVRLTSFARSHGGVVDEVQEVLAVSGNDSDLFAVFAKRVELVLEGCLELLTGDVGELRLSHQGFGLRANQFLLEDDDARRARVLILELGNLISDLLLAYWNVNTGTFWDA